MVTLYAGNPPNVYIDSQPIEVCREIKLLGCTLDSTLTFTQHCATTCRKAFAALSKLRKCAHCLPKNTKLLLVKSLVLQYFDYAVGLLLNLSGELCLKMQRCMNAAVRFVAGLKKWVHITLINKSLEMLPFTARRDFLCICLLCKILRDSEPRYLLEQFAFRDVDTAGSRRCSPLDLEIKFTSLDVYKFSFNINSAQLWNNLPRELRQLNMRPCFKPRLHEHCLKSAYNIIDFCNRH